MKFQVKFHVLFNQVQYVTPSIEMEDTYSTSSTLLYCIYSIETKIISKSNTTIISIEEIQKYIMQLIYEFPMF